MLAPLAREIKGCEYGGLRALAGRSLRTKETTPGRRRATDSSKSLRRSYQLTGQVRFAWRLQVKSTPMIATFSSFFCAPPGSPQLQTLRQAGGGRASRHAVFLRVQQRPAVPSLRQPGLPLRQTLLLLQSSRGLLTNAVCARSRRHSLFQRFF